MFKFFDFVENILEIVFGYLQTTIESVVTMFTTVTSGLGYLNASIGALPPFCRGALITILTISVLSVILSSFLDFG